MKTKALTWMAAVTMAAASTNATFAGDREWAVAGKVLTGVAVGSVLTRAFCGPPVVYAAPPTTVVYAQPAPVAYVQTAPAVATAQPVAYSPAPTVVYTQPAVVYAPAPVVYAQPYYYDPLFSVRVGFGFGPGYYRGGYGCYHGGYGYYHGHR